MKSFDLPRNRYENIVANVLEFQHSVISLELTDDLFN